MPDFLQGGGEMGAFMRRFAWDRHPLGPPENWPQALRTTARLMLTTSHPVYIWWGPELFCFYNDAYAASVGPEKHPSMLGARGREVWAEIWELIGPDIERVMAGQGATWHEDRLVPIYRHGKLDDVYWTYSYSPIDSAEGVGGVLVLCTETTNLVLDAQRREVARQRQQRLFEQAPAFIIIMRGPEHVVEFVNDAHRHVFDSERWVGRSIREAFPSIAGQGFFELLDQVYATGESFHAKEASVRYRRTPQTPLEERFLTFIYAPLYEEDGSISGIFCEGFDVTEGHLAQAQVRVEQQRFRAAVEAVRGTVWTNDATGRMTGAQPGWAALTGQSYGEYQDYGWTNAVHPDDVQPTIDAWAASVHARSTFTFEHRVRRGSDGQWRTFAVKAVPLVDDAGAILEWVGIHTDVTDARSAESALREADHRKDVFIATLAHELRNPLAPVRNALQVARSANATDAQRRWSHEVIDRQVRQMALLLDDLLDVSRITRGTLQLRRERVELAAVVDLAIETARPLIDARRHTLTVELPDTPVFLDADALRLAQVLSNLLNNAAKYSEPNGRIELHAGRSDGVLRLEVADSGIGIESEMLPNIFEMFSQSVHAIERAEGGLGIGLALVKGLVALHGGTVEAESAGRGAGSTFIVTLPCERAGSPATLAGPEDLPRAAISRRILVVDDNADSAESLALMLQLQGHETRSAHEGEQAIEIATRFRPHVVLLDIGMPRLNGYETAQRLRTGESNHPVTLVAVTGWGQVEDRKRAMAAGFDHHLVKPVDPSMISALLASLSPS